MGNGDAGRDIRIEIKSFHAHEFRTVCCNELSDSFINDIQTFQIALILERFNDSVVNGNNLVSPFLNDSETASSGSGINAKYPHGPPFLPPGQIHPSRIK